MSEKEFKELLADYVELRNLMRFMLLDGLTEIETQDVKDMFRLSNYVKDYIVAACLEKNGYRVESGFLCKEDEGV